MILLSPSLAVTLCGASRLTTYCRRVVACSRRANWQVSCEISRPWRDRSSRSSHPGSVSKFRRQTQQTAEALASYQNQEITKWWPITSGDAHQGRVGRVYSVWYKRAAGWAPAPKTACNHLLPRGRPCQRRCSCRAGNVLNDHSLAE